MHPVLLLLLRSGTTLPSAAAQWLADATAKLGNHRCFHQHHLPVLPLMLLLLLLLQADRYHQRQQATPGLGRWLSHAKHPRYRMLSILGKDAPLAAAVLARFDRAHCCC
jgi:hypothetical protein